MRIARRSAKAERASIDHEAIRLMLSYVEAECLRIGATDAARHAALAAALVPGGQPAAAAAAAASRRPRADRLH
jgi:hypothetical protein